MSRAERPLALVDGVPGDRVPVTDRGLLFGDGLFETLRVSEGAAPLWPWHWRRLSQSAAELAIELADEKVLQDEVLAVAGQEAAVRIVVTRGDAKAPGYAPGPGGAGRRIVMRLPLPAKRAPLKAGVLAQTLPRKMPGSSHKHLSRLPQVLLAAERDRHGWDEALVCDSRGHVLEATQGNVLARIDGCWLTPPVGSGVRGAFRQYLMDEHGLAEAPLTRDALPRVQSLAVCNAVRSIEPVRELAGYGPFDVATAVAWARAVGPP